MMKALIRKPFHYATRDLLAGAIVDLPDAVFEEFKRERFVTEAPPDELPLSSVVAPAEVEFPATPASHPMRAATPRSVSDTKAKRK